MKEFAYNSLYTEYSCTGDIRRNRSSNACFAYVFRELDSHGKKSVSYKIYVYKGIDWLKKERNNNACLLTKRELKHHIDQLKGIIPFRAVIREGVEHDCPCFIINLELKEAMAIHHKYILSWIRYAYEYPYNVVLLEAINLRKESEFKFESIFNLFNLIAGTWGFLGGGHTIACGGEIGFLKRKELEAAIRKRSALNNIFVNNGYDNRSIDYKSARKNLDCRDLEFWTDRELLIAERKSVYLEKYKKIKNKNK